MVRGRSASWSSSGMGVAWEGEERMGRLDSDILCDLLKLVVSSLWKGLCEL
jgi:hypothetical protein